MAFELLDEYEQSELVRKWLRENALSIATGVALGLALIFGWQQWKVHRLHRDAEAAAQYQALGDAIDARRMDDADKIAQALRKDYAGTAYAVFAAMRQADLASANGDTKAAAADLEWAHEQAGNSAMKALTALRLARVTLAEGDADAALKLLDTIPKDDYSGLAEELRGDALAKLGRIGEARTAYQNALTHLDSQTAGAGFVQMKLDDLAAAAEKKGS
ncbi:MAG: tetratricopeptide repeat protein [Rhodanobacteraceae bacterium]